MKNLNLKTFGVQEMEAKEMAIIDGGYVSPWYTGPLYYPPEILAILNDPTKSLTYGKNKNNKGR